MTPEEVEFLYESNKIEGVFDADPLYQSVLAWDYLKKQEELTVDVVLEVHRIMAKNLPGLREEEKGAFRTGDVWIGGRRAVPCVAIRPMIEDWLEDMNEQLIEPKDKEEVTKECHVRYERIHGLWDINGRTGRAFMNWHRLRLGLPILVIHAGKEQEEYYTWFR